MSFCVRIFLGLRPECALAYSRMCSYASVFIWLTFGSTRTPGSDELRSARLPTKAVRLTQQICTFAMLWFADLARYLLYRISNVLSSLYLRQHIYEVTA